MSEILPLIMTTRTSRFRHSRRKFGQISVSAMMTISGSTRVDSAANAPWQIDRKVKRVIDNVAALTRELLAGRRCGRNDEWLAGKLLPQTLHQLLHGFDFAYGDGVNPNRVAQLRHFQDSQNDRTAWASIFENERSNKER